MTYSEPLINQVYRFFLAVGFGILMGVLYEVLGIIKTLPFLGIKSGIAIDFIYSVIFTVLSIFFMLVYNEGEARANLVIAQITGIYVFHITFGKRIIRPFIKMKEKIRRKMSQKDIKRYKNLI